MIADCKELRPVAHLRLAGEETSNTCCSEKREDQRPYSSGADVAHSAHDRRATGSSSSWASSSLGSASSLSSWWQRNKCLEDDDDDDDGGGDGRRGATVERRASYLGEATEANKTATATTTTTMSSVSGAGSCVAARTDCKFDHKVGNDHDRRCDARHHDERRRQQVAKYQQASTMSRRTPPPPPPPPPPPTTSNNTNHQHGNRRTQTNNTLEHSDQADGDAANELDDHHKQDDDDDGDDGDGHSSSESQGDAEQRASLMATSSAVCAASPRGDLNQRQDQTHLPFNHNYNHPNQSRTHSHDHSHNHWQRAPRCRQESHQLKTTTTTTTTTTSGEKIIHHRDDCKDSQDDEKLGATCWSARLKLLERQERQQRQQNSPKTLINYDSASSEIETIISMLAQTNRPAPVEHQIETQTLPTPQTTTTTTTTNYNTNQINKFNYMSKAGDVNEHEKQHLTGALHVNPAHDQLLSVASEENNDDNNNKELRNIISDEFNYIPNEKPQRAERPTSEWKPRQRQHQHQRFNSLNLHELELAHQRQNRIICQSRSSTSTNNNNNNKRCLLAANHSTSAGATSPQTDHRRHHNHNHNQLDQVSQRQTGEQQQQQQRQQFRRLLNSSLSTASTSTSLSSHSSSSSSLSVASESEPRSSITSPDEPTSGGFHLLTFKQPAGLQQAPQTSEAACEQSQEQGRCGLVAGAMDPALRKPIVQQPAASIGQSKLQSSLLPQVVVVQQQQQQQSSRREQQQVQAAMAPRCYPNNTLLEDLTRCHQNVTDLFPSATRATRRTKELFKSCFRLPLAGKTRKPVKKRDSDNKEHEKHSSQIAINVNERQLKVSIEGAGGGGGAKDNSDASVESRDDSSKQEPIQQVRQEQQTQHNNDDHHHHHKQHQVNHRQQKVKQCRPGRRRTRRKINYHIPESILRTNSSLRTDDYDRALSVLTSDIRFKLHLLLYRRCQLIWTLITTILCIVAPTLLLAQLEFIVIISACSTWLALQLIGALLTRQTRKKLDQMLEKSVAQANSFFMDHNLMLGVINVGGLFTKTRLLIPMLYFDTSQCREQIESIISIDLRQDADDIKDKQQRHEQSKQQQRQQPALDYSKIGLPLTKPNVMALAQSQLAKKIVLRYSQRWISYFDRRKLLFTDDQVRPRHLSTGKCLCQFVEEHFRNNKLEARNDLDEEERALHVQEANLATVDNRGNSINSADNSKQVQTTINSRCDDDQRDSIVKKSRNGIFARNNNNDSNQLSTLSRVVDMRQQYQPETISDDYSADDDDDDDDDDDEDENDDDQQDVDSIDQTNLANERTTNSTSPVTDLSSAGDDQDGELLSNDELIKKLRFILELRKNDLNGPQKHFQRSLLNGHKQHATSIILNTNDHDHDEQFSIYNNNNNHHHQQQQQQQGQRYKLTKVLTSSSLKTSIVGKNKFNEGLFSFGGSKKAQQQQQQQQQEARNQVNDIKQVLQIC